MASPSSQEGKSKSTNLISTPPMKRPRMTSTGWLGLARYSFKSSKHIPSQSSVRTGKRPGSNRYPSVRFSSR